MILTEAEVKKLVRSRGHASPSYYDDAVQEALIAVMRAEQEKPGDKGHAVNRAITAARNYTRKERTRQKYEGGGEFVGGLCIHDESVVNLLIAPEDSGVSSNQRAAFYSFLREQDEKTRVVMEAMLNGDSRSRIGHRMGISHSQVRRIVNRFIGAASKHLERVE